MIKFMDMITEAVEQFLEGIGENALVILGVLAKMVILLTTPVWILPYKIARDIMFNGAENERSREDAGKND